MKRPAFQFYPKDWRNNANLRRCSVGARGAWMEVMCLLHDSDEYGLLRWPLAEIANAAGVPVRLLKELAEKGVMKGCDKGVTPALHWVAKTEQAVVTLAAQAGPLWFSSRMINDEHLRQIRAAGGELGREFGVLGAEHGVKGGRPRRLLADAGNAGAGDAVLALAAGEKSAGEKYAAADAGEKNAAEITAGEKPGVVVTGAAALAAVEPPLGLALCGVVEPGWERPPASASAFSSAAAAVKPVGVDVAALARDVAGELLRDVAGAAVREHGAGPERGAALATRLAVGRAMVPAIAPVTEPVQEREAAVVGLPATELLPPDFPDAAVLEGTLLRAGKPLPSPAHLQAQLVAFRLHYEGQALSRSRWYSKLLGWLQRNPEVQGHGYSQGQWQGHERSQQRSGGKNGSGGGGGRPFESAAERVARRARETGFVETGRR